MLFTPRTAGLYLTGNGGDENKIVLADIHKRVRTAARAEMATAGNEHFRFAVADRLCLSGQNDDNFLVSICLCIPTDEPGSNLADKNLTSFLSIDLRFIAPLPPLNSSIRFSVNPPNSIFIFSPFRFRLQANYQSRGCQSRNRQHARPNILINTYKCL